MKRSGQAIVEYIVAFAVLLGAAAALAGLHSAVRGHGARTLELVSSEYP